MMGIETYTGIIFGKPGGFSLIEQILFFGVVIYVFFSYSGALFAFAAKHVPPNIDFFTKAIAVLIIAFIAANIPFYLVSGLLGLCFGENRIVVLIAAFLCFIVSYKLPRSFKNRINQEAAASYSGDSRESPQAVKETNTRRDVDNFEKMIGTAIQSGSNSINVYDERSAFMFTLHGQLNGYTQKSVSVKDGQVIRMYSNKGFFIGEKHI
jgi:hypothetical protein